VQIPTNHIFEFTPETLADWCESVAMPRYRAKQILEWVYEKGVIDPHAMSNLGKADRDKLADQMTFLSGRTLQHQLATDGVQKLLIQWEDGKLAAAEAFGELLGAGGTVKKEDGPRGARLPVLNGGASGASLLDGRASDSTRQTECVMIPTEKDEGPSRRTACISSQVGCPVGCKFCASGLGGLDASLSAGRIVEQVWRLGRLEGVGRISNVVFMGMGEPLSNFVQVTQAIRTICSLWALGISARKVTISTVGLPKFIERLADEFELPVTLALSLHAPTDEIRKTLIPWAEYTTIDELLKSCQKWFEKTGREITLEYTLLRGINDGQQHAKQLADLARTLRANVNLIRYNEVKGLPFMRPETENVRQFQEVLRAKHINTHIRASRGRDIAAACGQLRHEQANA
jgi:23S rRNA (adenine2503-C2)-methyltransferase